MFQTEEDFADESAVNVSSQEPNITPRNDNQPEDSFVRGAPISSTPVVRDPTTATLPRDSEDDDSWAASIESPFERLGRQVRDLAHEETSDVHDYPSTSSAPSFSPLHGSYTGALLGHRAIPSTLHKKPAAQGGPIVPNALSSRKGKSPLRQNVLRQNAALAAASDVTSTPPRSLHTPRRYNPKNPFLPPDSNSREWNGLVDLRQPSPARSRARRTPGPSTSKGTSNNNGYNSDSSDDLFPPGMSPPVTMQFAMASRARASPAKLAPAPARIAAERIGRDLVAGSVGKGTAKHVRSPIKPPGSNAPRGGSSATKVHNPMKATGVPSIGSDSDSDSSEHDESNPSAGFLFATQNNARAQADDSFASSQQSMSSDENEDEAARAARHPLAHIFVGGTQGVEDSFDQDESFAPAEEDTVFGARLVGQEGQARPRLTLMRDALIDDTHPRAVSLNPHAQLEQSPTPYVGEPEELG